MKSVRLINGLASDAALMRQEEKWLCNSNNDNMIKNFKHTKKNQTKNIVRKIYIPIQYCFLSRINCNYYWGRQNRNFFFVAQKQTPNNEQ